MKCPIQGKAKIVAETKVRQLEKGVGEDPRVLQLPQKEIRSCDSVGKERTETGTRKWNVAHHGPKIGEKVA